MRISRLEYQDGKVYIGKVFHGTPHGLGHMMYPDNSSYKGNFLFGLMHGKGHYKFVNGNEFNGEFSNGLKHGPGHFRESEISQWTQVQYVNDIKKTMVKKSEFTEVQEVGDEERTAKKENAYISKKAKMGQSDGFGSVNSNMFTPQPHPDELKSAAKTFNTLDSELSKKEQV